MDLTVLGKSPSWQDRDGACSSYLVREDEFVLVLDCGSGAFGKLRAVLDYRDVDAVLLSHTHPDHVLDLIPFACALSYSPRRQTEGPPPQPALLVHEEGAAVLRRLAGAFGDPELLDRAFELREYAPDVRLPLGPLSARFREVPHWVSSFAVELTGGGAGRIVYSADCGPNEALEQFATGAELLLIEGTSMQDDGGNGFRGHMTPRQAGELGRRAGVRRLVITHFSDEVDPEFVRSEATAGFGGEVEVAHEGARYTV
jgi:ribonuclease BN (tRNA processing enzyme)